MHRCKRPSRGLGPERCGSIARSLVPPFAFYNGFERLAQGVNRKKKEETEAAPQPSAPQRSLVCSSPSRRRAHRLTKRINRRDWAFRGCVVVFVSLDGRRAAPAFFYTRSLLLALMRCRAAGPPPPRRRHRGRGGGRKLISRRRPASTAGAWAEPRHRPCGATGAQAATCCRTHFCRGCA